MLKRVMIAAAAIALGSTFLQTGAWAKTGHASSSYYQPDNEWWPYYDDNGIKAPASTRRYSPGGREWRPDSDYWPYYGDYAH